MELIAIQISATAAFLLGHLLEVVRTCPGRTVMDSAHLMHYDNATRSRDHEHDEIKVPYHFADLDAMQADFWTYVHARSIRR